MNETISNKTEKEEEEVEEFFKELEKQRSLSLYKPTGVELLEVFPEAEDVILSKVSEYKDEIEKKESHVLEVLEEMYRKNLDPLSTWFAEITIKNLRVSKMMEEEGHLLRLKRLNLLFHKPIGVYAVSFQEKLERARNYPISEIAKANLMLKTSGSRLMALCPFHNEKHPSFFIFPATNSFHCFGCGEHGDVIKLTMKLEGVDFKQAIQILSI